MKTFLSAVAATLLIGAASAPAQAPYPEAANAPKFGIAVVDVSYIFKEHKQFIATMEGMKTEMQGIEQTLKTKQQAIMQLEEKRNTLNPGTPDYKAKDEQLVREKADFSIQMDKIRKDLMEREKEVYFKTYQQVSYIIANYARQRKIGLVLRFNGDKPDPGIRQDVLKDINKPVVFENNIDITRDILALVNGGAAAAVGSNPGAGARPTETQ